MVTACLLPVSSWKVLNILIEIKRKFLSTFCIHVLELVIACHSPLGPSSPAGAAVATACNSALISHPEASTSHDLNPEERFKKMSYYFCKTCTL